ADAHSFDGALRWQNVETTREYVKQSRTSQNVRAESSEAQPDEEKFFVGLRLTEGIETNPADWQRFGAAFERLIALGMMEQAGARLRLTPRGVMVSNEIFQEFIAS